MLIITGCGRCGTSLLARFCYELGADMDGKAVRLPGKGEKYIMGWEDPDVANINQRIMDEQLCAGPAVDHDAVKEEMKEISRQVVKDPRFVFCDLIAEWATARNDISVLMLFRDFGDIVRSVERNREYFCGRWVGDNKEQFYRDSFARAMQIIAAMGIPFRLLFFPDFLGKFDQVCEAFHALGFRFDLEAGRRVWAALVDRSQVTEEMAADGHTHSTTRS